MCMCVAGDSPARSALQVYMCVCGGGGGSG
jgi:hypothetical protein